jgi:hypothetical protein
VKFVDDYCQWYDSLFPEIRSFEAFKNLYIGMLADIKRKLLPAIAILSGARAWAIMTPLSHSISLAGRQLREQRLKPISRSIGIHAHEKQACHANFGKTHQNASLPLRIISSGQTRSFRL